MCFSLYILVNSKNSPDNYKICKINVGAKIKTPEMLRIVSNHLKAQKMSRISVIKLPFVLMFVPNRYKTQKMNEKVIVENGGML